jgi:hypothetical protein
VPSSASIFLSYLLLRAAAGAAAASGRAERVIGLLVERVPGISQRRGHILREHLGGRDPLALSWEEWRCASVGDRLAQRIQGEVAELARAGALD